MAGKWGRGKKLVRSDPPGDIYYPEINLLGGFKLLVCLKRSIFSFPLEGCGNDTVADMEYYEEYKHNLTQMTFTQDISLQTECVNASLPHSTTSLDNHTRVQLSWTHIDTNNSHTCKCMYGSLYQYSHIVVCSVVTLTCVQWSH